MKKIFVATLLSILCFSLSAQWQKIDIPFTNPLVLSAVDSNTLWCFNFSDPKIARTTDGGANWSLHDIPNAEGFLLSYLISAIDTAGAWVAFKHYSSGINYVYQTLDGGQSWQSRIPPSLNSSQVIHFQKFYNINNGVILAHDFNDHVFVYRTTDAGQTWISKTLITDGAVLGTATYGDKHIWFYTGSGEIWRTSDGGENWSTFQTTLIAPSYGLAMDFADSLNGLAFKDKYFNQLYRTTDGGASWQEVPNPDNPTDQGSFVWGLTKIPDLPQAWIVGYNEGTAYTLDDGHTWITENNYPDYDFRQPVFLNHRQGWGAANGYPAIFKWADAVDTTLRDCLKFLGPLSGTLRRSDCQQIWFQGNIRVDIADDPGIHLRTQLFYPDNPLANQSQTFQNISTGCPDCPVQFVPDEGQTTIGQLYFEMPVSYAFDTSQTILCMVSPTQCAQDSSSTFSFHTGYFANWFHPECFGFDTSDCAIQLLTNVCGIDTNQYLIYYSIDGGPLVLGDRYEKNPSYREKVRFYIYAWGNLQNSTCYEWIDTLYSCGVSSTPAPTPDALRLRVAPNPASGAFRIFCDKLPEERNNMIRVKNAAGVLVWSQSFPQGQPSLFMERHNLPDGFYVLELWSDHQLVAYEKLVLVRSK